MLRGSGRIDGPGGCPWAAPSYTAERHRDRDRLGPRSSRRSPGLRELDGVWTNREATGLTEVPRRLLVLGGGPVGVEMAQAVARMGGAVALVEGADHVLPREPAPLGEALAEALGADGVELHFGQHAAAARREDGDFVLEFPERRRAARRPAARRHRPAAARRRTSGLESVGIEPGPRGIEVDARMSAGDGSGRSAT